MSDETKKVRAIEDALGLTHVASEQMAEADKRAKPAVLRALRDENDLLRKVAEAAEAFATPAENRLGSVRGFTMLVAALRAWKEARK